MPKHAFLTAVDASAPNTSAALAVNCDQDYRWLLHVTKSGTDGNPDLFIEEEVDGTWSRLQNPETLSETFPVVDGGIAVKDSYFMGKNFRVVTGANGTTIGTITAEMHYKSKV